MPYVEQMNISFAGKQGNHYPKAATAELRALRQSKKTNAQIAMMGAKYIIKTWNEACVKNRCFDLRMTVNQIGAIADNPITIKLADDYREHGNIQRAVDLYPNQIEIAVRVTMAMIDNDQSRIALLLETQYGKTGILCLAILMFNAWQKVNDGRCFVRLTNPNRISSATQTDDDLNRMEAILAPIMYNGVTIHESNAKYFAMQSRVVRKANTAGNLKENDDFLAVLLANTDSIINQNGYDEQFLVIDEADEALGARSYLDKVLNRAQELEVKTRLLLCSATAWEYKNLESFTVIHGSVTNDYAGFLVGTRVPVVSFSTMAQLTGISGLKNFSITRDYTKTQIAIDLILAYYRGIDPNKKATAVQFNNEADNRAGEFILETVTAADLGFNGLSWNGGEGCMIRYGRSGAQLGTLLKDGRYKLAQLGITMLAFEGGKDTIITFMDKKLPRDEVIPAKKAKTVQKLIEEAKKLGVKNYVVCVVDRARRADRFPKECTCFIDMSERPTSMTALEQGTLGRASGWFKITKNRSVTTLFSDDVSKIIIKARKLYDVHRKKIPVIKPSSHSLKNWREPSYRMSITIDLHEGHMWDRMSHDLRNKFRRINDVIMGQIDFDEKGSPFTKTPKKGEQWELVGDDFRQAYYGQDAKTKKAWVFFNIFGILTKDNLSEIEALYGEEFGSEISLLLPLECRNDDGHRHYSAADATHVHFALRNWESAEQQGKGRFSVTGSRETRGKDGKQRSLRHESLKGVLDMSALLSYKEKRVRGLTFILTDNAQDRKGVLEETADFTFPKPNTAPYKHFTTADDRDIINNLIKSKLVA